MSAAERSLSIAPRQSAVCPCAQGAIGPKAAGAIADAGVIAGADPESKGIEL
jgi:hypothetical protein